MICPWWLGYLLLSPIRKLFNHPVRMLAPFVEEGMTVLDYGCAMGYFSIPMARLVGREGVVYCVDIQEKMLDTLKKRALKYGVSGQVKPLLTNVDYRPDELTGVVDFALLFAVAHEVPDKKKLFNELSKVLKTGGLVYLSEPKGHVSITEFKQSVNRAIESGFIVDDRHPIGDGLTVVLKKTIITD